MKYIKREDITNSEAYNEIFKKESHHDHKIIQDERGVYRWESDPLIDKFVTLDLINLNDLIPKMWVKGMDKNSEEYRELYRKIGYSLSGYWEVFYWECNNEDADKYNFKQTIKQKR